MKETTMWNGDRGDGTYSNPILHADYSDPDAIRVGEDYYMISSSFCNAPGLPVLHSKDLVNWELINYVLKALPEERYDKPIHGCGVWAPSLRYHDGIYYACFPMPDEGIYMSTTRDPYGEWSKPINIRSGAGWIDPCPFWDEDGKAYLVAGVAKSRIGYKSVLHMVEMKPDGSGLIGEEKKIFDGNENDQVTIEGPKMYKRNGYYYIFAPAGGVKIGWQTVLRSKKVFGPYEYKVVMRQGDSKTNGPHQGAWVDTVTGEDWFLHFQDLYAAGRVVHLQPMTWKNDWPIIGMAKDGEDFGQPVSSYRKPNVGELPKFERMEPVTSDDFSEGRLNLAWQWNANPHKSWYAFSNRGLVLKAVKKEGVYGDTPNLLLQKWPAPEFVCVTKMDLSQLKIGDQAGFISMGMEYGLVSFTRTETGISLETVKGKQQFGQILAEQTEEEHCLLECVSLPELETSDVLNQAASDPNDVINQTVSERGLGYQVWVQYLVERVGYRDLSPSEKHFPLEKVTISYSFDGKTFKEALTMDAIPGRWVGVKNGVFCLTNQESSSGYVVVESVEYNRIKERDPSALG